MKAELRDLSEVRKSLVVEIPTTEVDAGIERLSQRYRRSLKVPGFRPGKAPAKLVRLRLRDQILQEVVQDLIPKAVDEAIREHDLEPVDTPAIRDVNIEEGHPLTFTATLETLPTVDPGEYQSLTLRRPPVDVTGESVAAALERLRERAARFEAVEGRDVAQGDTVTVDLERRVIKPAIATESSKPGEQEPHENIEIEIGGSANPPGFDEQLLGLSIGASRDFTLTYPEDHENTGLAGSEVAYTVAIKAIREKVLQSLDDEFARELGSFDTLAALTDQLKADLVRQAELDADGQVRSELLRQLAGRVEGEVPESLIAREVDRRVERFVEHLINQRVDPRRASVDWDAFRKEQHDPATATVRSLIVIDEIARKEALTVEDAELDQEVVRQAERAGRTVSAARALLEKEGGIGRLRDGMRREKAIDFVLTKATIVTA
jgi:trigger factor